MAASSDKVALIAGLTASGKSALAMKLAKSHNGEIVNADSMQIYRHFDIGTAKASIEERTAIKHHLIDIVDAHEVYSVARFVQDAREAISDILSRHKLPIICGGSGQYTTALLSGIKFWPLEISQDVIEKVDRLIDEKGYSRLKDEIVSLDPETGMRLAAADEKRIRRFFLVYEASGLTRSQMNEWSNQGKPRFDYRPFCLAPSPEYIYPRIEKRTDRMFERGLVAETRHLRARYENDELIPFSGIGYRHSVSFLRGDLSQDQMIALTKRDTRRYAKRQRTWYRHHDHGRLWNEHEIEKAFDAFQRQLES